MAHFSVPVHLKKNYTFIHSALFMQVHILFSFEIQMNKNNLCGPTSTCSHIHVWYMYREAMYASFSKKIIHKFLLFHAEFFVF